MIDENILVNTLVKSKNYLCGCNQDIIDKVIEVIKMQPKVNEWIPIEERLPEEKGLYLVAYHPCYWDNVKEDVLVGIDNFTGKTSWSRRKYQRVIAWQSLPEPYKGE